MPERRPVVGIRIGIDPGHLVKFLLARCLSFNRYQRYLVSPILLWGSVSSGDYLRFLAASHTLAEVEEVVTGTRTADDAYDSYLRVKEGQQPDDE